MLAMVSQLPKRFLLLGEGMIHISLAGNGFIWSNGKRETWN